MSLEDELELSKERYRRLFNESVQGIAIFVSGRIHLANPAYAETLGRSLDELLEMSADEVWTLVHPDDRRELEERNKLLSKVKILPSHRFRYIRPSGEIRWVDSYVNIVEHDGAQALQTLEVDITDQIDAERALRENEERFRTFVESSDYGFVVLQGIPPKMIYINPSFSRITGFTNQELMSMAIDDVLGFIDKGFRGSAGHYIQTALEKGERLDLFNEFQFERKDGVQIWLRTDASIITLNNEHALQILVLDITDQKELTEAMIESEKRFRGIFEAAPIGILLFDTDGRIAQLNKAAKEILGIEREEDYQEYRLENDPNLPERIFHNIREGAIDRFDVSYDIEAAGFKTSRTSPLHMLAHALPVDVEEDGSVSTYLAHIQDVTDRIQIQEILRRNEEKYRTLFESANDAIFLMRNDVFIECNDKTLDMYGCSREQILGSTPFQFSPQFQQDGRTSKDAALEKIEAALAGKPQFFEWKHTKYDGTPFDAEVGLNVIQLGEEVLIQAIVRDVTKRKLLEQKTKSASRRGMLYLDLLTHDVKNKLQALELFVGLIAEKEGTDSDIHSMICDSIGECHHLISKVETTKKLPFIPLMPHSLQEVLSRCVEKISKENSDVEILLPLIPLMDSSVLADEFIDMLFCELMENGIKHNKNKDQKIWIIMGEEETSYDVSIADNGPGISLSMREHIFNPDKRTGGVGLHLVYEIVEKYQGSIRVLDRVDGVPSMGTMFVVSLPKMKSLDEAS